MINTFLNKMLIVFFCLVNPISKKEKPKCIKNTSAVHTIIHTLFAVNKPASIIFVRFFLYYFKVSSPWSPVRILYASVMSETNIFPSPISPVPAAFKIA